MPRGTQTTPRTRELQCNELLEYQNPSETKQKLELRPEIPPARAWARQAVDKRREIRAQAFRTETLAKREEEASARPPGPPPLTAFLTFISRQRYILK